MKQILVKFGLVLSNSVKLINNATVYTDDEVEVLTFDTDQERQDYIDENGVVVEINEEEDLELCSIHAPELPNDTWLKAEIQEYLTNNGIEWKSSWTKAQLLAAV